MIKSEDVELAKPPAQVSYDGFEFTITNGDKSKKFTAKDYIDLVLELHFDAVDRATSNKQKVGYLLTAEIQLKRTINKYGLTDDFSEMFEDLAANYRALSFLKDESDKWRFFWSGAGVSFISGLISAILVWCITKDQKETPTTNIEFPKDSIVIYLRENALKLKDTSLVRLVKRTEFK